MDLDGCECKGKFRSRRILGEGKGGSFMRTLMGSIGQENLDEAMVS